MARILKQSPGISASRQRGYFLSALFAVGSVTTVEAARFLDINDPRALEPTFRLDRDALMRCRAAALFDANSRLRETIAACSGNVFILDGLRRLDRLRRLMEYRKAVDRDQAERRCREHLTLIDLLITDQREAAADFMKLHLHNAVREKTAD